MSACRSCEAPIVWAEWEKSGKRVPLDEAPSAEGNVVMINGKCRIATDEDKRLKRPLYKSRFATCPDADQHRRSR